MIKLTPYRQKPGFCGPASLKMVAEYYDINKSEDELGKLCDCNPITGTRANRLIFAARKIGLIGFVEDDCNIDDLRFWVEQKKVPVIINWFSIDEGHYSPVVAVTDKEIVLRDPEQDDLHRINIGKFEKLWFDFEPYKKIRRSDLIIRRMIVIHKKKPKKHGRITQ